MIVYSIVTCLVISIYKYVFRIVLLIEYLLVLNIQTEQKYISDRGIVPQAPLFSIYFRTSFYHPLYNFGDVKKSLLVYL